MLANLGSQWALPVVAAAQVDERRTRGAVAHALHQLPEIPAVIGGEDVACVAKIMHVNVGQTGCFEGRQPHALTKVAVVQSLTGWAREDQIAPLGTNF